MTTIKELHEVMVTEAQLAEGLALVLEEQQDAIIKSRTGDLDILIEKSEDLIQPIATLESERVRLAGLIISERERTSVKKGQAVTSRGLLSCLADEDAVLMEDVIRRLRTASEEVLRINGLNMPLLEHSNRFVKQTLRAATDDYKKNLIDKRM